MGHAKLYAATFRHYRAFPDLPLAALYLYRLSVARRKLTENSEDSVTPIADNATLEEIGNSIYTYGLRVHVLDHTLLFGTMAAAFGPDNTAWWSIGRLRMRFPHWVLPLFTDWPRCC